MHMPASSISDVSHVSSFLFLMPHANVGRVGEFQLAVQGHGTPAAACADCAGRPEDACPAAGARLHLAPSAFSFLVCRSFVDVPNFNPSCVTKYGAECRSMTPACTAARSWTCTLPPGSASSARRTRPARATRCAAELLGWEETTCIRAVAMHMCCVSGWRFKGTAAYAFLWLWSCSFCWSS
jgi:hypothetical protein